MIMVQPVNLIYRKVPNIPFFYDVIRSGEWF